MYDLIIVGAGPGGYVAAERAGALGMSVLLVEKSHLGGVCLNQGCIPTKTLLHTSKLFIQNQSSHEFGVLCDNLRYDLKKAMALKDRVRESLRKAIAFQMKRHHVEVLNGVAELSERNSVRVNGKKLEGKHLIIATGSSPAKPPIPGLDSQYVLDSSAILEISTLPQKLTIIGGGYIGMEFASFFSNLGVDVTVIEMMPEIIPFLDPEIAVLLRKSMPQVTFHLDSRVQSINDNTVHIAQKNGSKTSIKSELILVAVGRSPNTSAVGLDSIGVSFDRQGIHVNELMQTNIPGVYAVGDVTGRSLLAHSASRMGEVAVNVISSRKDQMRYQAVPWVVYTYPEVAGCGLAEHDAIAQGRKVKIAKLQLRANSRHLAEHPKERGLCKVLVDEESQVLLGVHLLGAGVSEIIYGAAAMIESQLRIKDVREIVFPHPTVSEIIKDTLWELN